MSISRSIYPPPKEDKTENYASPQNFANAQNGYPPNVAAPNPSAGYPPQTNTGYPQNPHPYNELCAAQAVSGAPAPAGYDGFQSVIQEQLPYPI